VLVTPRIVSGLHSAGGLFAGAFVEGLCGYHNETHGTALEEHDYFSYHFADVWGTSVEEVRTITFAEYLQLF
jgi:hypothetical protein